jgi:two-component system KDP operon response regulator KdpE
MSMAAHPPDCRILVVDDDPPLRKLLVTALRREGHTEVFGARNGAEAVEKLASDGAWSVLVLDLMMPTLSGWDVLNWLAENESHVPRTVIVASAASREILRELDPRLVNAILFKPFDVFQVAAYVSAACKLGDRDRRRKRVIPDVVPGSGER